jgi:ABC-2 type transport system permease protein
VSPRIAGATGARILRQLRADPRTVALLLVVPCVLVALMKGVFYGQEETFQRIGVPLVGLFPLLSMFLVTSITMLRERTTGTLERLMSMPLARIDLLSGYALAFGLCAMAQGALTSAVAFGLLGLNAAGSTALIIVLAVINALLGMAFGLFVSAFAATEFQAVQFLPAFLLPQILLCGLFVARSSMWRPLELLSDVLPMTYAYDGLARVAASTSPGSRLILDVVVVLGSAAACLVGGAATLRRRTP